MTFLMAFVGGSFENALTPLGSVFFIFNSGDERFVYPCTPGDICNAKSAVRSP